MPPLPVDPATDKLWAEMKELNDKLGEHAVEIPDPAASQAEVKESLRAAMRDASKRQRIGRDRAARIPRGAGAIE